VTAQKAWLAVLAVGVYMLLWIGYAQQWDWLAALDRASIDATYRFGTAHPAWIDFWVGFSAVFGPSVFRLLGLVVIVVALVRRNLRTALFLLVSVELSGLVVEAVKAVTNRPRPAEALVFARSTAFPSGHAVGAMVGVLALLTVVLPMVRRPLSAWLVALSAVVVVAVGLGRALLVVHHPSDVIAGWALGYLYYAACLLVLRPTPLTATAEKPEVPDSAR
jgi:membrane-associated phospholipid phosphatase